MVNNNDNSLPEEFKDLRKNLLFRQHIFTGEAKPNVVRLLPSLALTMEEANMFLTALSKELKQVPVS